MSVNHASADRIEKQVRLSAPVARVWQALTDSREFGQWFRVKLNGAFTPGATLRGPITYPGYEHLIFEVTVETLEPQRCFSFRWHPYAIDPGVDYSHEPTTLVVFTLQATVDGTLLTVVESGFDNIPASRRAKAFEMNTNGWATQMQNVKTHLGA